MTTPRVSVIIPCYNTARFAAEAVGSVFSQTYTNFEVVIVNDGSPDTVDLERALAPWWDRIVYVKTDNFGLAGARNNGIRAATGELIGLLDSDDIWEPNYLDVQVQKLDDDPSADIVFPRALIIGDGPGSGTCTAVARGEVTFTSLVNETSVVMVSVLARRSALESAGLFDPDLRSCEDFDMWVRCVKNGSRIVYHNHVLVKYRRRKGSLSSDPVWMCGTAHKVCVKLRNQLSLTASEREVLDRAIQRFEGNRLLHEGKRELVGGNFALALQRLEQANQILRRPRIELATFFLRTAPWIAQTAYKWRLHRQS